MSNFSTLTTAQVAALQAVSQLEGVAIVVEDTSDLATEIAEQILATGMVILIGIPSFRNETDFAAGVLADIDQQILVRECPPIWRDQAGLPHCQDVAQLVAKTLHGLNLTDQGFQMLRVMSGTPLGSLKPDPKKEISFQDYHLELKTRLSF